MTLSELKSADSAVALLRDPYRFVSRRAAELGEDVFETRLLLRRITCMTGAEASVLLVQAKFLDQVEPLLAMLQFGDGAAAAFVSGDPPASGGSFALGAPFQTTLPDSAALIRWSTAS